MHSIVSKDTAVKDDELSRLLRDAYSHIRDHRLDEAATALERALELDFEHPDVLSSLKYVNFWRDRAGTVARLANGFEQGEYLLAQWRLFEGFVERIGAGCEECLYAVRTHVYDRALQFYQSVNDGGTVGDPELLLRIGRCYKGKGDYDTALSYLNRAYGQKKDDPELLAELADCYAFVNEVQKAKVFFREAFFIGAGRIDIEVLESELIRRLVTKVREMGYNDQELLEWIPVYGWLYGVFTVRRELRSIEYGKLKQSIYALERDYSDKRASEALLVPRLVNRYFWLIDHYISSGEDRSRIEEVLLKLRSICPKIYEQYRN